MHEQTPNLSQIIDGRVRFKPDYIKEQLEQKLKTLDSNITITWNHTQITVNIPVFVKTHNTVVNIKYVIDLAPLSNNKITAKANEIEITKYTKHPNIYDLDNYQSSYRPIESDTDIDILINDLVSIITLEYQLATKLSDLQFGSKYDI